MTLGNGKGFHPPQTAQEAWAQAWRQAKEQYDHDLLAAVSAERERCAKIAETSTECTPREIADAIRTVKYRGFVIKQVEWCGRREIVALTATGSSYRYGLTDQDSWEDALSRLTRMVDDALGADVA